MLNSPLQFRTALPSDADAAIPLIYSAGPQALNYGFTHGAKRSQDFLRFAFEDGKGFFGFKNHTVATVGGAVVGIAAFYNLSAYVLLSLQHTVQVGQFFGFSAFAQRMGKGLHLQSLMPPPAQAMHYVANFGVLAEMRGQGIGQGLLDYQQQAGRLLGRTRYALDVSVENPRAQALYERYGFVVQQDNAFTGIPGAVPNTRRMEMPL